MSYLGCLTRTRVSSLYKSLLLTLSDIDEGVEVIHLSTESLQTDLYGGANTVAVFILKFTKDIHTVIIQMAVLSKFNMNSILILTGVSVT